MKIAPVVPTIAPTHTSVLPPEEENAAVASVARAPVAAPAAHTAASPLEGSMEEVSMTFAEQMERKSKSLNQRRITQQPGTRAQQQIERIDKLNQLLQLLEHPRHARLEAQTRQMQTLLLGSSSQGLTDLLQAAGDDPARCDVLLRHSIQHAQLTQNSTLAGKAVQALELLHQEKGKEVHAGLNTAAAIASFSTDPGQKQAMRQLYYQTIVHLQSGHALLDTLLSKFGEAHFTQGLRSLQRALADDIAARSSSIPRSTLQKILTSLQDAGRISQTISASHELLNRLKSKLPVIGLSALELTRRVVNLSGNGAYLRDLQNMANDAAGSQPKHQLLFFSGLLGLVQQLPAGLWREDKSKNRQMALNLLRTVIGEYSGQEPRATLKQPRARW